MPDKPEFKPVVSLPPEEGLFQPAIETIQQAVAAEREAIAQLVESLAILPTPDEVRELARRIRARR